MMKKKETAKMNTNALSTPSAKLEAPPNIGGVFMVYLKK
jgi:hypothetical protein